MTGRRLCCWLAVLLLASADANAGCEPPAPERSVRPAGDGEFMIATLNLWRLRDTDRDARYDEPLPAPVLERRLDALAWHIRETLAAPHLLALQEVENETLLNRLARTIADQGGPRYRVHLREGHDPSGIDVGLMARDPVTVAGVDALFASREQGSHWLFSRPPLHASVSAPVPLDLVVVHLRSGRGLDQEGESARVRARRRAQAQALRDWARARRQAGRAVVVAGDINSAGEGVYGEPLAILMETPLRSVWQRLPVQQRYSHVYRCREQAIDNILYNDRVAGWVSGADVSRGNAGRYKSLHAGEGGGEVVSDHDSPVLYLRLEKASGGEAGAVGP